MNAQTHDKPLEPVPLRRVDKPAPEDAELAELFRRVKPQGCFLSEKVYPKIPERCL